MDEADTADRYIESVIDDHVAAAMRLAANIPEGTQGECDFCGEYFSRLVNGACGYCRDKYHLE